MNRVIIIMAKVPRAGNVKTRLQPILDAEKRRTLAEAFLSDAIFKTRNLCDALIIAYAPAGEAEFFSRLTLENLILIAQQGNDLGEKMSNAFNHALQNFSAAQVLMIGTDSPTFPAESLEKAFSALAENIDVVLGEAADGGFYLIGLRENHRALFKNIEWSTTAVYKQITRNIADLKLKLQTVSIWYDVDTPPDLQRLRREFLLNETARKFAPATYQWLLNNANNF